MHLFMSKSNELWNVRNFNNESKNANSILYLTAYVCNKFKWQNLFYLTIIHVYYESKSKIYFALHFKATVYDISKWANSILLNNSPLQVPVLWFDIFLAGFELWAVKSLLQTAFLLINLSKWVINKWIINTVTCLHR